MAFHIITDSACDLPKEVAAGFDIEIIPTPVVIDGEDYLDGETIFPQDFYDVLREGKDVKTYHVSIQMFYQAFEPYAKRGDSLLYICFSTGIAGTFNAANIARKDLLEEYPGFDLTIVDSKAASMGFGLLVYYAGLMKTRGAGKDLVIEALEYHINHMKHVFTVETLEYLFKGGRLSRTSAMAGEILNIKPIIKVDEQGSLVSVAKVKGRKKALRKIVDTVGEWGTKLDQQWIGTVHGDDKETIERVKNMLSEKYGITKFIENYIGCAIGAHTGPGIIGITFLTHPSPYIEEKE